MPPSDDVTADAPDSDSAVDALDSRLRAVERALTDGETPVTDLDDAETLARRVAHLEDVVDDLEERLVELETASRALRGYAGGISAVNEDVERRADLALAKVESLERTLHEEPGLRVERLDPEIASNVADEEAPSDVTGGESDGRTENSGDAGGRPEAESVADSAGNADRSLAERLRDAL